MKTKKKKESQDVFDRCEKVGGVGKNGEWFIYEDELPAEQVGFWPEYHYHEPHAQSGGGMIDGLEVDEEDD